MTELYDTSWMNTTTNPVDIMLGIGISMSNQYLIGNLILLMFFLVFLILSVRYDFLEILIIDGFISTIIAVLFFFAGIIAAPTIMFPFVIMTISLVFYLFS